jgi:cytochrome c peroxidase
MKTGRLLLGLGTVLAGAALAGAALAGTVLAAAIAANSRARPQAQSTASSPVAAAPPGITIEMLDQMSRLPGGLGPLPEVRAPADNPQTAAKVDLGSMLFHDKRLSRDQSISCATCHDPAKAFSDRRKTAIGVGQKRLPRRTPSLLNAAYNSSQFWDGRAGSLEDQASRPVFAANEMGANETRLLARLRAVADYRQKFRQAFNHAVNFKDVEKSIAAFERTLVTPGSAFDRYMQGDKQALSDQQKRGLILFFGKAACSECHNGPNFTDNKFHSLGLLPGEPRHADPGRYAVTHNPADRHAFKTPSLRNVTLQSPYMHDGSIETLPKVIDFYNQGGGNGPKSKLVFKLGLTPADKEDLLAFLRALVGKMPFDAYQRAD